MFSQSSEHHRTLWERACSRRGRHIQHEYRLTHRLRRQAGLAPTFGEHRAPTQCTVNRNRALPLIQNPTRVRNRTPVKKTRKPRVAGLSALPCGFLYQLVKTWHAPCNSPFSDSVHYPVSGTLVQAGRGFPSFTSGSHRTSDEPCSFGALDTGRSGVPSLHRAHNALAMSPPVLGSLVQAGRGFLLYTGPTLQAKSSLLGTLIQAGQGFPLLHPRPCP